MRAAGQLRSDAFGSDIFGECGKAVDRAVDTANRTCSQNQNRPEFSTHRSPPTTLLVRECYTALDTMSLASRRRRDRSIVQVPPEDALVERIAEDMPQELSSGQSRTGDFL